MSGSSAQPGDDTAGAAWRSLSGDPLPEPPRLSAQQPQSPQHPQGPFVPVHPQAPMHPIPGGWQQPWQDEFGQWHYPYAGAQPDQAPPYEPVAQAVPQPDPRMYATPVAPLAPVGAPEPPREPASTPFVQVEELVPVGPPRYLAPARVAQDPRRRTMAAVIVFVSLLVALWAILGFMDAMSRTLASVSSGSAKLEVQLADANTGLAQLGTKTSHLEKMSTDSAKMKGLLGTIDTDMGTMLAGVEGIATSMTSMNESLGTLEGEIGQVNTINADMSEKLATINAGLGDQVKSVQSMRKDVQGTGRVLQTLPGRLGATNSRLAYVNNAVNIMGCRGITNNLEVKINVGPIPNGSAKVFATIVPPGAWGTLADGVTPCPAGVAR